MSIPKIKIATTIVLTALACSGVCLTEYSSMLAGQPIPPIQPPPPTENGVKPFDMKEENKGAEKPFANLDEKMLPDGRAHDFGVVPRGTLITHSFRVVNTSAVPLQI